MQTGWLGSVTTNIGAGMELQVIAAAVIGGAIIIAVAFERVQQLRTKD